MAQRLMRWWVASVGLSLGWASYSLALTPSPHASRFNGDASRLRRENATPLNGGNSRTGVAPLLQRWLGNPRTALAPHPSFSACPANVEPLVTELLKDLPSYANRVSQQARRLNRTADFSSYVLVAGRPEFAPLTLGPGEYTPSVASADPPQQVFFTTLERQYTLGKAIELQQYHWLFLTQTTSGWRLAMMFSQIGPYPAGRPPTPPRDSSNGVIAQAIRTWLGDCRSGAVNINRSP